MTESSGSSPPKGKSSLTIIIAVVIAVIVIVGGSVAYIELTKKPTTVKVTTPTPTPSAPPANYTLTDTAQVSPPDYLDPASGFFVQDETVFTNTMQELVEYNGSNISGVNCVIASHMYNVNNQNFIFTLRTDVKFSNNNTVNASTVWFSFYRGIVMGQGPYVDNYLGYIMNISQYINTGVALPWGAENALIAGGYTLTGNASAMATEAANDLGYILSNFNDNSSNMKIMEYKDQAVVVNSEYNVSINTITPYAFFPEVISEWWGAVVDPSYVDAHGGVVPGHKNSYIDLNGMIGTGPYEIKSVSPSFSTIVLVKNPNYWAVNQSVPTEAQPAHIKNVVIDYGLSHVDRLTEFDDNTSQISYVGPSTIGNLVTGYYNSKMNVSKYFQDEGAVPEFFDLSMNLHMPYTNNTDFRKAIYYAMNYTDLLSIYADSQNGTSLATEVLGPITPNFPGFYNLPKYPLPSCNLAVAEHYLTLAGQQEHFYVVLPNGTEIGDTSGYDLSDYTFTLTAIEPVTNVLADQMDIFTASFANIGLTVTDQFVSPSAVGTWCSPSTTPQFVDLGWVPDWPDPVGQLMIPAEDYQDGGEFGANNAWVDNATLQSIFCTVTSQPISVQEHDMQIAYEVLYNITPEIWLPNPYSYYFVQPYIHGFQYNEFTGYWYNLMYVNYSGISSSAGSSVSMHSSASQALHSMETSLEQLIVATRNLVMNFHF